MSPLMSLKTNSRRSSSPRETREFSFNEVTFSESDDGHHSPEMSNYVPPSRPLTVAIPDQFKAQGSYCPRKPNLHEILANQSPPPWTLSAFMAYLSHNHCLETLEFTMDAQRYRQHFEKVSSRAPNGRIVPGSEMSMHMNSLWQRLMQAYIQPNGPREVNLPSDVRDGLLSQDLSILPPHPDTLQTAIEKVHELMEESVLVPFLNSLYPQTAQPGSTSSSVEDLQISSSYDERGLFRSRTGKKIRRRGSPFSTSPPPSTTAPISISPPVMPPNSNRASTPSAISQFARSLSHSARHGLSIPHSSSQSPPRPLSTATTTTTQAPTSGSSHTLTPTTSLETNGLTASDDVAPPILSMEDNVSTSVQGEPMTPPTTPPTGDLGNSPVSAGGNMGRTGNPWKRMRYSFGWKKKSEPSNEFEGP